MVFHFFVHLICLITVAFESPDRVNIVARPTIVTMISNLFRSFIALEKTGRESRRAAPIALWWGKAVAQRVINFVKLTTKNFSIYSSAAKDCPCRQRPGYRRRGR